MRNSTLPENVFTSGWNIADIMMTPLQGKQ